MLSCDQTITLIRTDGETYQTEVISGVSWYDKSQAQTMERGLQKSRTTMIRIPATKVPTMFPQVGDLVVHDTVSAITSITDIAGKTYCRVMTVSDNRRSGISDRLQHVALTCE